MQEKTSNEHKYCTMQPFYTARSVRENVVSHSKKRKKSCFLDFEKNVKKT